ncbi:MAG TPA: hypothetical protein VMM37_07440 [Bacteroidota bacterium]|nr:hypothetical protein [Bacteroidota bacterium]
MSYKLRNSIVLGALALLITVAGLIYWKWYQPKKLKDIAKRSQQVEAQLTNMQGLLEQIEQLEQQYREIRRKYDSRSKEIPTSDVSSQTYAYMSRGQDEAMTNGGIPKFNMTFEGAHAGTNYGFNSYKLTQGTGVFSNLFKFVYYLENGRRLYKIRDLTIDQREEVDPETKETKSFIDFSMELDAYYSGIDVLATSLAARSLTSVAAPFDPFNPLVLQTISTEAPVGQIDVNKIDVKAILPGKAFALSGDELILLHVGDKVWRGRVTRINPSMGTVDFLIDEGGLFKRVEKSIIFEKRKGR